MVDPSPLTRKGLAICKLVVNIGDLFAMWTNDLYVSTLHQASNVSGRARLSVP